MISRYSRQEMAKIWTEENKLQKWLEVELAALEGLARYGYIPKDVPAKVRARAKFDVERCAKGLEALREYKAEWDPDTRTFRKTAKHDWASHGSDAFGHMSVAWREPIAPDEVKPIRGASEMTMDEAWKLAKAAQNEPRI